MEINEKADLNEIIEKVLRGIQYTILPIIAINLLLVCMIYATINAIKMSDSKDADERYRYKKKVKIWLIALVIDIVVFIVLFFTLMIGANHFGNLKNNEEVENAKTSVDFIINWISTTNIM